MKKIAILLLSFVLSVAMFAACGKDKSEDSSSAPISTDSGMTPEENSSSIIEESSESESDVSSESSEDISEIPCESSSSATELESESSSESESEESMESSENVS